MDGERKSGTERILSAIEYGKLSNDETERRLCELVEAEVNKTDSEADMELIRACQSLMWQLHTHGDNLYDSHYDANKARIDQRIRSKASIVNTAKAVAKTLVAAAAVMLLFVGIRFSWFEHSDTPDGQQHVITGQEITVEMVQAAIAENVGKGTFETTDLNELRSAIGFDPQIPEKLADEWQVSTCMVRFARRNIQVTVAYSNKYAVNEPIKFIINYYTNASDGHLTLEQSYKGDDVRIGNQTVYLSSNIDNYIACWSKNNIVYEINCAANEDIFTTILSEIVEGGI